MIQLYNLFMFELMQSVIVMLVSANGGLKYKYVKAFAAKYLYILIFRIDLFI